MMERGFSAPEKPSAMEALIARSIRNLSIPAGGNNARNPFSATAKVLQEARGHFADYCAIPRPWTVLFDPKRSLGHLVGSTSRATMIIERYCEAGDESESCLNQCWISGEPSSDGPCAWPVPSPQSAEYVISRRGMRTRGRKA